MVNPLRDLPSVDRLLAHPAVASLVLPHELRAGLCRTVLEEARQSLRDGRKAPSLDALAARVEAQARALLTPRPRRVVNATGVVIHTNLGRVPLSREAREAVERVARGYTDLEFDLEEGERGSRHQHVEALLVRLTGAEGAMAVNNNAAAVLLAVAALAQGREILVSRGEAVEIGGRFRIPDVLRQSGAVLVEVGTTNRTYLSDYAEAITERTAALLKVHRSNFAQVGFTESVEVEALAGLAHRHGLLLLNDLGSGCLLDTTRFGLDPEPTVQASVAAGADLSLFSGDKLLGGPQAGIAVGRREAVDRLAAHPLARAVRMDKLDLAALSATLLHYMKGEAEEQVPVWRMIAAPLAELDRRARAWALALGEGVAVVDGESAVGGGSLPGQTLPTRLLAVPEALAGEGGLEGLARRLRQGDPPVVGRVAGGQLLLDLRTVLPEEDGEVVAALRAAHMPISLGDG